MEAAAQPWHDFDLTAGAAAATLVGLLFVGLSLHIRVVVDYREVRGLARVTLSNFFSVLVVSLLLLAPQGDSTITGALLVGVAAFNVLLVVRAAILGMRPGSQKTLRLRVLLSRFGLSIFCSALLAAMGGLLYAGKTDEALGGLLGVIILFLVVSVRNTWDLLVTVAEGARER